jgi:hypothetical protein
MEEFREIEFEGSLLRVYRNGDILRWYRDLYWKLAGKAINSNGYSTFIINKNNFKTHRIIAMVYLGLNITDTKKEVDHIDGNKSNNNINNLRIVPHKQNMWNCTKAKGYVFHKRDKIWETSIRVNNKKKYIGRYNTEEEARDAYLKAKEIYHKID